ncbi:alpha-amylase family glycosyl hydrolase [Sphingomonas bacterium]|uniref:alpha-amylase family glycosyl hydrolase n=1 Tax=Sphingomonas bacterium TaxID=1895847 RepID=UPI001575D8F5|nr:alpha-amylase family glycosyl hydrolase [Sphingomonas bacterium]
MASFPYRCRHLLAAMLMLTPPCLVAAASSVETNQPWWKRAVIYEVYVRSFQDADGDGLGDLRGVVDRLPYLQRLGVDAIWLTPFYPSPQVDFGYDISDYRSIDPRFGSLANFDRLVAEGNRRGVRVIVDLVLNHTSDQHPWFRESASSRDNPRADWYVWSDGVPVDAPSVDAVQRRFAHEGRAPPNNWTSGFGGSAWEWVPARRQFYYHRFYRQQPDLNWRNPAVERAMTDVMRFWLDRGVAGFRLDAVTSLFEDPALRDEPAAGGLDAFGMPKLRHVLTDDLPEEHAVIRRLRAMVDRYSGSRVLIGETWVDGAASMRRWYGAPALDELQLPMDTVLGFGGPRYSPDWFRRRLREAQTGFGGGQPLFVFDNHDTERSIDKFADGVHDIAIAKGIATILYASQATALTYYGAEIGMRTRPPLRREDVRDPIGLAGWPQDKGRDGERRPMQWTAGAQAGFTTNPSPWLPVDPDRARANVASEEADPASLLGWTKALIALRRSEPGLQGGTMTLLDTVPPGVLAWQRLPGRGPRIWVAINMSAVAQDMALPAGAKPHALLTTEAAASHDGRALHLPPFAIWIGRVG